MTNLNTAYTARMSNAVIVNSILTSTDPQFLTGLITDELFSNYRSYIKQSETHSSFDYTTLSTKIAYDAFTNTSTTTLSGNVQIETIRKKSIMTYAKQYVTLSDGSKRYSYRIVSQDTPIIVTANATSTISPASFTNDVETVEQTFTMNVLKTSTTQTFIASTRDDFLTMPTVFTLYKSLYYPPVDASYYSLRMMLLNYYGMDFSVETSSTGSVFIAMSFILGLGLIMYKLEWNVLFAFLITTVLPIILAFFNKVDTSVISQQALEQKAMFNQYVIFSGVIGTAFGGIKVLSKFFKADGYTSIL